MTTTVWAIVLVAAVALIIAGLWLFTRDTPPPPPPARHRHASDGRTRDPHEPVIGDDEPPPTSGELPV